MKNEEFWNKYVTDMRLDMAEVYCLLCKLQDYRKKAHELKVAWDLWLRDDGMYPSEEMFAAMSAILEIEGLQVEPPDDEV